MNKKVPHTLILFVLLISGIKNTYSQKHVETQNVLWTRYYLKVKLNDNYQIKEEIDTRKYLFPWRQNQFLTRTLIERKLTPNWSISTGMAYSQVATPNDPDSPITDNISELRPLIELTYNQKLSSKFILNHRYWSEFRFFEQPDDTFDFSTCRMRYKLELNYAPNTKITFKAFDEIFLNIGGQATNLFDQNRYGLSAQYMPLKNLGFELGYLNWYQKRASGIDFYNRHLVRLTIHQTIHLKKQKT